MSRSHRNPIANKTWATVVSTILRHSLVIPLYSWPWGRSGSSLGSEPSLPHLSVPPNLTCLLPAPPDYRRGDTKYRSVSFLGLCSNFGHPLCSHTVPGTGSRGQIQNGPIHELEQDLHLIWPQAEMVDKIICLQATFHSLICRNVPNVCEARYIV